MSEQKINHNIFIVFLVLLYFYMIYVFNNIFISIILSAIFIGFYKLLFVEGK